ncbi:MAG: YrdB family protein [Boseongicola sp.]
MHPSNLVLRFFLEIAALVGFSVLAWRLAEGWWRFLAVIAILVLLMALWGVFAVPGDPSRSGGAPIPISGLMRLVLELAILLGGACAFYWAEFNILAIVLTALVAVHYVLSGKRITWLLKQ